MANKEMKKRYSIILMAIISIILLFTSYVYSTAYLSCPDGLQWDLSCSFPHAPNGPVLNLLYEMIVHWDDFDDIHDEDLFLERYPKAEIFYEQVGYGVHFKHYIYTDEDTGGQMYLMMVKNTATGETDNRITCPGDGSERYGYAVWNENIPHYLQNYDCFSDDTDEYFEYYQG